MTAAADLSDKDFAWSVLRPLAFRLACRDSAGENVAIGQPLRAALESALGAAATRLDVPWRDMASAPTDGTIIQAVSRYRDATAGAPTFVFWMDDAWREPGREIGEPMVCWAWRPRHWDWPAECAVHVRSSPIAGPAAPPELSTDDMARLEAMVEEHTPFVEMLNYLRADEGDSVTLNCDNPDGPPNNAVECCGGWTDWTERRFAGESLDAAVRAAYQAKRGAAAP